MPSLRELSLAGCADRCARAPRTRAPAREGPPLRCERTRASLCPAVA
jgi:hypothetical protein